MATYFISDLHLCADSPKITELFLHFLSHEAKEAEALYILGDLFETWIGDDNHDSHHTEILAALEQFSANGIPVFFMPGNRDFLLGGQLLADIHCQLLPDPTLIYLNEQPIVLTHGDQLCTLDKSYQRYRKIVQHPMVRKLFLKLPLAWRQKIAIFLRSRSHRPLEESTEQNNIPRYFDVALSAVYRLMREKNATILIHGHTHRANIHEFILDGKPAKRIVLGDWGKTGSVLIYEENGPKLQEVM
jgi:UDP-2,3-diacylglucosamine hydrolase